MHGATLKKDNLPYFSSFTLSLIKIKAPVAHGLSPSPNDTGQCPQPSPKQHAEQIVTYNINTLNILILY